ncbi:hypothetical protein KBX17_01990 [Corynebacterium sp. CCUG 65737]|uniref:hypothetical protein n=1 Tax=Corynebacterium sp. CCUG 65737 TaxID=2823889 RepID=UPI00210B87FE|nr:hypothetical protein [Corynebacterium sp. CCUG 65737]MCQ4626587.1 hypothetical protein [Corynebacterium sp. CCUG 65737]
MTAGFVPSNVRHWTLEEAVDARDRVAEEIAANGKSVKELRFRASEWSLSADELNLLDEYERLERMIKFANGEPI